MGEEIRSPPGEEREQEERRISELLQPPSVLQGKMDSDSGEQSDGDLSPGKPHSALKTITVTTTSVCDTLW